MPKAEFMEMVSLSGAVSSFQLGENYPFSEVSLNFTPLCENIVSWGICVCFLKQAGKGAFQRAIG